MVKVFGSWINFSPAKGGGKWVRATAGAPSRDGMKISVVKRGDIHVPSQIKVEYDPQKWVLEYNE